MLLRTFAHNQYTYITCPTQCWHEPQPHLNSTMLLDHDATRLLTVEEAFVIGWDSTNLFSLTLLFKIFKQFLLTLWLWTIVHGLSALCGKRTSMFSYEVMKLWSYYECLSFKGNNLVQTHKPVMLIGMWPLHRDSIRNFMFYHSEAYHWKWRRFFACVCKINLYVTPENRPQRRFGS